MAREPYIRKSKLIIQDIHLIYPMVKYLGEFDAASAPVKMMDLLHPQDKHHYYTCKHFDTEGRNCTIYDDRPSMCREYPYEHRCKYEACTWTSEKADRIAPESLRVLQE